MVSGQTSSESRTPVTITANVDTATVVMGGRAMINVEVVRNTIPGVLIDGLKTDNQGIMQLGNVEVSRVTSDSSDLGNGRYQINYKYQIQPFEVGPASVGPFKYAVDGDTIISQIVSFRVDEPEMPKVMRDSLLINPMESTVSIESKWYDFIPEWWPWALLGLGVIALIVLVAILFKKNGPGLLPRKKVIPPYQLAMSRLTKLKQQRIAESGHDKEYFTELTDILRQYLDGRFMINAREMTSSQIIEAMTENNQTSPFVATMNEVLTMADFAKFAKHQSNVDDNIRAYGTVYDFIEATKPEETAESDNISKNKKPRSKKQHKEKLS